MVSEQFVWKLVHNKVRAAVHAQATPANAAFCIHRLTNCACFLIHIEKHDPL